MGGCSDDGSWWWWWVCGWWCCCTATVVSGGWWWWCCCRLLLLLCRAARGGRARRAAAAQARVRARPALRVLGAEGAPHALAHAPAHAPAHALARPLALPHPRAAYGVMKLNSMTRLPEAACAAIACAVPPGPPMEHAVFGKAWLEGAARLLEQQDKVRAARVGVRRAWRIELPACCVPVCCAHLSRHTHTHARRWTRSGSAPLRSWTLTR